MTADSSIMSRFFRLVRVAACLAAGAADCSAAMAQQPAAAPAAGSSQEVHEAGPPRRIPRQQALTTAALDGTVRGQVADGVMRPVGGARIQIKNLQTGQVNTTLTGGEGVFRFLLLLPGAYELRAEDQGYEALAIASISLN